MDSSRWHRRFYRVPADSSFKSDLDAVNHSLRKWLGFRKKVLKKFGYRKRAGLRDIYDKLYDRIIRIDADTCSLCQISYKADASHVPSTVHCICCPLYGLLGNSCDIGERAPYLSWLHDSDPVPMVTALYLTRLAVRGEISYNEAKARYINFKDEYFHSLKKEKERK